MNRVGSMVGSMSEAGQPFSVLTVCMGNICRSPTAERLIQQLWIGDDPAIQVASTGIQAVVGEPIQISMAHLLEQAGAYSGEFSARAITADLVAQADLVLGMTRRHRTTVMNLVPSAAARVFTLPEFARVVVEHRDQFVPTGDRATDLASLTLLAVRNRTALADRPGDDIDDPYGRTVAHYERAFLEIQFAVAEVAAVLTGEPVPGPPVLPAVEDDEDNPGEGLLSRLRRRLP